MSDNNFNDDEFFNKIENNFSLLKLLKGRNIVLFAAISIKITAMILSSGQKMRSAKYNNLIIIIYNSYVNMHIYI